MTEGGDYPIKNEGVDLRDYPTEPSPQNEWTSYRDFVHFSKALDALKKN